MRSQSCGGNRNPSLSANDQRPFGGVGHWWRERASNQEWRAGRSSHPRMRGWRYSLDFLAASSSTCRWPRAGGFGPRPGRDPPRSPLCAPTHQYARSKAPCCSRCRPPLRPMAGERLNPANSTRSLGAMPGNGPKGQPQPSSCTGVGDGTARSKGPCCERTGGSARIRGTVVGRAQAWDRNHQPSATGRACWNVAKSPNCRATHACVGGGPPQSDDRAQPVLRREPESLSLRQRPAPLRGRWSLVEGEGFESGMARRYVKPPTHAWVAVRSVGTHLSGYPLAFLSRTLCDCDSCDSCDSFCKYYDFYICGEPVGVRVFADCRNCRNCRSRKPGPRGVAVIRPTPTTLPPSASTLAARSVGIHLNGPGWGMLEIIIINKNFI